MIEKSLNQLFSMEQEELVNYFEGINVESKELLALLKQLDIDPGPNKGRKKLIRFVASELHETGRFKRIALKGLQEKKKE